MLFKWKIVVDGDNHNIAPVRNVADGKTMVTIIWRSVGFHMVDFMLDGQTTESGRFIQGIRQARVSNPEANRHQRRRVCVHVDD
jgi:hypothetical protein